jgi:DNA-binding LytR/AlgR family response regulator
MKCLIVDDDPLSRGAIEYYCGLSEHLDLVGSCESAVDALNFLSKNKIDIIFLDVEMPEMTGLEMLETMSGKSHPYVILVTSKKEYAVDAFEYNVIDYLLKPVDYVRFLKAINKLLSQKSKDQGEEKDNEIFVKSDLKFVKIKFDQILYVEAMADYVIIHVEGAKHIIHSTMKGIDKKLAQDNFVRVHRSYIVNLKKIDAVENNAIILGQKHLPIGASYKNEFMNRLKIL